MRQRVRKVRRVRKASGKVAGRRLAQIEVFVSLKSPVSEGQTNNKSDTLTNTCCI